MSTTSHYEGRVHINPSKGTLKAKLRLVYKPKEPVESLTLLLHRDAKLHAVKCDHLSKYEFIRETSFPFAEEGGELNIHFTKPLEPGQLVNIDFNYSVRVGIVGEWKVNRIIERWVEVGLYMPWYPFDPQQEMITYQLEVYVDDSYHVVGLGKTTKEAEHWLVDSNGPQKSMLITAAPNYHKLSASTANANAYAAAYADINIWYTSAEQTNFAEFLSSSGAWVLKYYSELLVKPTSGQDLNMIIAPRDKGGSYVRGNLMVMQAENNLVENQQRYFSTLAHETAHVWWNKAPVHNWEDWLNEGFAEYFCRLALKAKYGEDVYLQMMAKKRKATEGLPPIMGINRSDKAAHSVLYSKGCLVLHDLAKIIGEDKLMDICRTMYVDSVVSTEGFLDLLRQETSAEIATEVRKMLES